MKRRRIIFLFIGSQRGHGKEGMSLHRRSVCNSEDIWTLSLTSKGNGGDTDNCARVLRGKEGGISLVPLIGGDEREIR